MKTLAKIEQAHMQVQRIHTFFSDDAKATFTIDLCSWFVIDSTIMTFAAAECPERSWVTFDGNPEASNFDVWSSIPALNTTLPITMAKEVAIFRANPRVAVAVAVFSGEVCAWIAMSGGWKRSPAPKAATTSEAVMYAFGESGLKLIYSPFPIV